MCARDACSTVFLLLVLKQLLSSTLVVRHFVCRDDLACVVCFSNLKNVLFMPCRHIATCSECADKKNAAGVPFIVTCPMCNKRIKKRSNVFL